MSLKEHLLKTVVMGAMSSVVKDVNDAQRKSILDDLLAQYKDTGNKSYTVALPTGDKVATVTLNESKPETVVADGAAFFAWCKANRPDLVETVEHPATEAWLEERLVGAAVAHVVEDYKLAGDAYITGEGEPVEGVEFRPAPDPSKFTMTYTAKDRGLSVVQAWRDGFIPVELDANLPVIEP